MAEETLFTDIINTLGKAKKEGKISGGYRYKDGKLNIGGGYYGDDSMFEIDVNKDGGNILFKKRFTNLSFALTIIVSNNESSLLKLLRILITGNLILSIFLRFRLFNTFISIFLDLSFFSVLK